MAPEARKQSMAWMETDYSKHSYFRWKVKWRLEHLGALGTMGEPNTAVSSLFWVSKETRIEPVKRIYFNVAFKDIGYSFSMTSIYKFSYHVIRVISSNRFRWRSSPLVWCWPCRHPTPLPSYKQHKIQWVLLETARLTDRTVLLMHNPTNQKDQK